MKGPAEAGPYVLCELCEFRGDRRTAGYFLRRGMNFVSP
jgi:hypothetical protein